VILQLPARPAVQGWAPGLAASEQSRWPFIIFVYFLGFLNTDQASPKQIIMGRKTKPFHLISLEEMCVANYLTAAEMAGPGEESLTRYEFACQCVDIHGPVRTYISMLYRVK
jgi:hypothetical protein